MPNWCECDLYIYGDELVEISMSAEDYIPYPEKFKNRDKRAKEATAILRVLPKALSGNLYDAGYFKDGFNLGGYEWCCDNWGTKWGICEPRLAHIDEEEMLYQFQCAWSPCIPVVVAMSARYPQWEFDLRYFEAGCAFNGMVHAKNGEIIRHEQGPYFGRRGG